MAQPIKTFDVAIEHVTLIRARPDQVYDIFTTASELDRWFTTGAEIDARPGGVMVWRWKDWGPDRVTLEDRGPVLEAVRGERFVFQWGDPATTVSLDFQAVDAGTALRLREWGYPDTPQGRAECLNCATGWGEALTLLKFYVEHGIVY